jgi:hypothetical protein
MWGTTPPYAKLTGDSANRFEAALIGACRLFHLSAENSSLGILGVLQHYPSMNGRRQIHDMALLASLLLDRLIGITSQVDGMITE